MRPYYDEDGITIYHADCRSLLPELSADLAIVDPPYGDTSLAWDVPVDGWVPLLRVPTFWCFGSFRFFQGQRFDGWKLAQDIVWEKHNGATFHADRFQRVHELVAQFYRGPWGSIYHNPVRTNDATKRTVRRKGRPPHTGDIGPSTYVSEDGGPRLMRSVIRVRSTHHIAVHPTQKPLGILTPLLEYSLRPDGIVLDPFMGSGSTLVAAKLVGRRAVGVEIDERYCEIAARRLSQGVLPLEGIA